MYLEKDQFSKTSPFGENAPENPLEIPEKFLNLREKINALAYKTLEERFSEEKISTLRRFTEDDEKAFREHVQKSRKREPTEEEIENERKGHVHTINTTIGGQIRTLEPHQTPEPGDIVLEPGKVLVPGVVLGEELIQQMQESGVKFERNQSIPSAEVFDLAFSCEREECLGLSEQIQAIYRGYGDGGSVNVSGDHFRIRRQKTGKEGTIRTDLLLLDAQEHGAKAMPLALLAASFLRAIEDRESREIIVALDAYLAPIRLQKKEVSLVRATLDEDENAPTKKLSFMRAGEAFAFWIEGDKETGFVVKIISDRSITSGESLEIVQPTENSGTGPVGDGVTAEIETINSFMEPQVFDLPRDAAVFLASDGIFDMINRRTGRPLKEHFFEICRNIMKEMKGKERGEVESRLFEELQRVVEDYEQTDDITVIKLAA